MEERRKELEKLDVSPLRGGGEVSQPPEWDLGWGGSQASPHGECFSTRLLSSLPCEAGLNTPEELGRDESPSWGGNGPSWGWLKTETKTGKCPQSEVHLSQWSCTDRFQGVREPHTMYSKLCIGGLFFFFLERRARVFITFFKGSVTPPKSKAASIEVPELLAPPLSSPVQAHHAFQLSEFVPTSSFLGYS